MIELRTAPVARCTMLSPTLDRRLTHITVHIVFRVAVATVIGYIMLLEDTLLPYNRICRTRRSHIVAEIYCQETTYGEQKAKAS